MATITVRGHGTSSAQPDEVAVGFTVEAVRPRAAEAFAEASRLAQDAAALCDELGVPVARRTTSRISLAEHGEHTSTGWQHRGYRRLAAADARSKAEEYAAALGGRIGVIASVVEPGAAPPGPQPRAYVVHQEISGMPLEGGEQEIDAEIDVTFQLEQG